VTNELSSWITAIAAAVGASFAIWKWGFEERLRRRHEIPSIDGDISVDVIEADDHTVCVYIENLWDNKGAVPIFLNPDRCVIRIYEIALQEKPRAIDPSDDASSGPEKEILSFCPIRRSGRFMLEPGTQSRIQSAVLLQKGPIYEVRSHIEMDGRLGRQVFWWFRRKVFVSGVGPASN
jgi:hypothetical protein